MHDSYIGAMVPDPGNPRNPQGAKRAVSVFELTVWAYRRQMVQYEVDKHPEYALRTIHGALRDDFARLLHQRSHGLDGRGCLNGAGTTAAVAAHIVHAHVRALGTQAQRLIIASAVKEAPPNWDPVVPSCRFVPAWKGQRGHIKRVNGELKVFGRIRMIWNKHRHAIGCLLDQEGTPAVIAEAIRDKARAEYRIWWNGLARLQPIFEVDPRFADFSIQGIGAAAEPWLRKGG